MNLSRSFEDKFLQDPLYLDEIGGDPSPKKTSPISISFVLKVGSPF
jgi:hypothetical protein